MGIADPGHRLTRTERKPVAASGTTRRASWQATADPRPPKGRNATEQAEPAASDENERAAENRTRAGEPKNQRKREARARRRRSDAVEFRFAASKTRWRAIKMVPERSDRRPTGKLSDRAAKCGSKAVSSLDRCHPSQLEREPATPTLAALACAGLPFSASIAFSELPGLVFQVGGLSLQLGDRLGLCGGAGAGRLGLALFQCFERLLEHSLAKAAESDGLQAERVP